jgi:sulfite exporter TauE/SafE
MGLGTSLILIAVGAVLKWAVTVNTHGINLQTVGLILLIIGAIGLLLSILYMTWWNERRVADPAAPADRVYRRETVVRDPRP